MCVQEDMLTIEAELDHRIHPRIIGQRGRQIRKIMDDFKVDIRFPRSPSENQDIVYITGAEDNCYDCKDHLLNIQEEYVSVLNVVGYSEIRMKELNRQWILTPELVKTLILS